MPAGTGRQLHTQQMHYLRKTVTFAGGLTGLAAGVLVGTLPFGALPVMTSVFTTIAWNGTVSVALSVGLTATGTGLINGSDVRTSTARVDTVVPIASVIAVQQATADVDVWTSIAFGGTIGTAGSTSIVLTYIPNNDG